MLRSRDADYASQIQQRRPFLRRQDTPHSTIRACSVQEATRTPAIAESLQPDACIHPRDSSHRLDC